MILLLIVLHTSYMIYSLASQYVMYGSQKYVAQVSLRHPPHPSPLHRAAVTARGLPLACRKHPPACASPILKDIIKTSESAISTEWASFFNGRKTFKRRMMHNSRGIAWVRAICTRYTANVKYMLSLFPYLISLCLSQANLCIADRQLLRANYFQISEHLGFFFLSSHSILTVWM